MKETATLEMKQMKILLLVPSQTGDKTPNVRLIKDQLRHLVKEVLVIKYPHNLEDYLGRFQPNLILALGSETTFPEENTPALKASTVPKAVWMADSISITRSERNLALLFDYIFTQREVNLTYYSGLRGKHSSYLPYAADTDLYYPRRVNKCYHSDVLILGHFRVDSVLPTLAHSDLFRGLKVMAYVSGWEPAKEFINITHSNDMSKYYNGARMVIHCTSSVQQIMEVAACGVFQLVEDHLNLHHFLLAQDDLIRFHSFSELVDHFKYYSTHSEKRRISASRTLQEIKYHHSYTQHCIHLLKRIFNKP